MQLISRKLIVGEEMGSVPDNIPRAPLQEDVVREQRRLRLKPDGEQRDLDLDLRKPNELDRSLLLHRLNLIGVPWGEHKNVRQKTSTFHELWRICWNPEFEIRLIEMGAWGNTLPQAASNYVKHLAEKASDLPAITTLISSVLLCDLSEATDHVAGRLRSEAAVATDVLQLMAALPPLLEVGRYGNVRQTDLGLVKTVAQELVTRSCVGLPLACASLSDEAAAQLDIALAAVDDALKRAQEEDAGLRSEWLAALEKIGTQSGVHGLIAGHCCRLQLDGQAIPAEEAARRLNFALSANGDIAYAGAWCEGFLKGSGLLLIHDEVVWGMVDEWVSSLSTDHFTQLLPILRRAFSAFQAPERRQLGERVAAKRASATRVTVSSGFDQERAEKILPLLAQLLGLKYSPPQPAESKKA